MLISFFSVNYWLAFFHGGISSQRFICRRVSQLKLLDFCTRNRNFMVDRKCRRMHLLFFLMLNFIIFWSFWLEFFQQVGHWQLSIQSKFLWKSIFYVRSIISTPLLRKFAVRLRHFFCSICCTLTSLCQFFFLDHDYVSTVIGWCHEHAAGCNQLWGVITRKRSVSEKWRAMSPLLHKALKLLQPTIIRVKW